MSTKFFTLHNFHIIIIELPVMATLYKLFSSKKSSPLANSNSKTPTSTLGTQKKHERCKVIDKYHSVECNRRKKDEPLKVIMNIETPPILMFGMNGESSGAFFSGNVIVDVYNEVKIKSVKVYLIQVTKYSMPFTPNQTLQGCEECTRRIMEIANWDLLPEEKIMETGKSYSYPISQIIPGDLPPSTFFSKDSFIKYELVSMIEYGDESIINLSMPIMIQRSILRSHDRNSLRIFPPTDITASAVIPNVVYPRSVFPIEIRMDHVVNKDRRWRMRKLNWRLEESTIVKLGHCSDHTAKFESSQKEMKKLQRNRKMHKSSGGIGHNTLNFYFDVPDKVVKARALAETARVAAEQEMNRIQEGRDPVNEESEFDIVQTNEMGPLGSNWTLSQQQSPTIAPMTSLSDVLSGPRRGGASTGLANPDEVILQNQNQNQQSQQSDVELYVEELKALAMGELKSGWKSDFSGDGRIEMNVEIPLNNLVSAGFNNTSSSLSSITSSNCNSPLFDPGVYQANNNECNCSVDVDDPKLGVFISHNLILEAVVGEEVLNGVMHHQSKSPEPVGKHPLLPQPSVSSTVSNESHASARLGLSASDFQDVKVGPQQSTGNKSSPMNNVHGVPTGVARVLRMQFRVCLTERSGMGVSWDMEVPPTYEAILDEPQPPQYV